MLFHKSLVRSLWEWYLQFWSSVFQKNAGRVYGSLKGLVKCLGEGKAGGWEGRTSLPGKPHLDSVHKHGRGSAGEGEELLAEEQIIVTWSHVYCGLSSGSAPCRLSRQPGPAGFPGQGSGWAVLQARAGPGQQRAKSEGCQYITSTKMGNFQIQKVF